MNFAHKCHTFVTESKCFTRKDNIFIREIFHRSLPMRFGYSTSSTALFCVEILIVFMLHLAKNSATSSPNFIAEPKLTIAFRTNKYCLFIASLRIKTFSLGSIRIREVSFPNETLMLLTISSHEISWEYCILESHIILWNTTDNDDSK